MGYLDDGARIVVRRESAMDMRRLEMFGLRCLGLIEAKDVVLTAYTLHDH
jgi:hypothetical protein